MEVVDQIYGRVKAKLPPAQYKGFKAFSSFRRVILLSGCGLTDNLPEEFPRLLSVFMHPNSVPIERINFIGIQEEFEAAIEEYNRSSEGSDS